MSKISNRQVWMNQSVKDEFEFQNSQRNLGRFDTEAIAQFKDNAITFSITN